MTFVKHGEAHCLMTYRSDDGTEEEVIWNSRDGVTPFAITLRSGKVARHVNWADDRRVRSFEPPVGSRIFIDMTEERAREIATQNVEKWWNGDPLQQAIRDMFRSKEHAIEAFTRDYFKPGAPDLIEMAER